MGSAPKERADGVKELEYTGQAIPKGRRFCTLCGKVKRESNFDGDSTHCRECCAQMLHTRLHWYGVLPALLVAVALAAAVYVGVQTAPVVRQVHTANALAENLALYEALEAYETAFDTVDAKNKAAPMAVFVPGTRTWENYYALYAQSYSEYDAANAMLEKLNKAEVGKRDSLRTLQQIKTVYDAISAQISAISQAYPVDDPKDMPYEEVLGKIAAIEVEGDPRYVNGYLELFKADLTQYCFPEQYDAAFPFYDKALEYLPEEYLMICVSKAQLAMDAKDYEQVIPAAKLLLEKNRDFTDAYGWLAESYYAQGKKDEALAILEDLQKAQPDSPLYYKLQVKYAVRDGDLAGAEALCNRQDELNSETAEAVFNTLLARQEVPKKAERIYLESIDYSLWEAALMLLQGDENSAFNIAYNYAFNYAYYYNYITGSNVMSQSVINMTTLCAELCTGKDEKAEEAKTVLSQVGMCDEQTQKIIDGEISLEEAFIEGKVDWL